MPDYKYQEWLTPEILVSLLTFNEITQDLFHSHRPREMFGDDRIYRSWNSRFAGKPAFLQKDGGGYLRGSIMRHKIPKHRVCWCFYYGSWPDGIIDHISGVVSDNSKENLRVVTQEENSRNASLSSANSSGYTGVYRAKRQGCWRAGISLPHGYVSLGVFDTKEEAVLARSDANEKHGFHKNHGKPQSRDT